MITFGGEEIQVQKMSISHFSSPFIPDFLMAKLTPVSHTSLMLESWSKTTMGGAAQAVPCPWDPCPNGHIFVL